MARGSHGKLDASAPAFSPSAVQLPQRQSGTEGQSQGPTASSAGGTTEMKQGDVQLPTPATPSLGSTDRVGVSSSTEDSSKAGRSESGHGGRRRRESFGGDSPSFHVRDAHCRDADDVHGHRDAQQRRRGDRRPRRLSEGSHVTGNDTGDHEGIVVEETGQGDGYGHGGTSGGGKGRKKSDRSAGANANHLLNFQFQPISGAQSHSQHHHGTGEGRAGGRRGNGSFKGRKGGKGWGEGSSRGPMSRDQFLQANFQFLLHEPTRVGGDESSASPVLQEAFVDPDVLVDWDTVDTVRQFRKVSRRSKALSREGPPPPSTCHETKINRDDSDTATDERAKVHKTVGASSKGVRDDDHGISWGSALRPGQENQQGGGMGMNDDVSVDATITGEGQNREEEWRCPICLGMPIAPRITKCGHGPFCLVCILRHLRGEAYARCPLCFDNIYREQLRRAIFQEVATYMAGGRASLLLLQRERVSLAPRTIASGETEGGVVSGMKADVPGVGGVCPREGEDSERYSRLVVAKPSTLARMSASEQASLQRFRLASIASGETEWVPFVSEAQASVAAQVERFSLTPAATAVVEGRERRAIRHHESGGGDDNQYEMAVASSIENKSASSGGGGSSQSGGGSGSAGGGGAFRFFQSLDGQRAFLHPLDMKQLMEDVEKGLPLPTRIDAPVLEVETVNLTPEMRRRLPFLGHLPIHCDISFLELDMSGFVSEETAQKFQQETQKRERKRRARTAAEARSAAREAKEEKARRARIAALRAFTIDLQGPKPGDVQPNQTVPSTQVTIAEETTTTISTFSTTGAGTAARNGVHEPEGHTEGNLATESSGAANAPPPKDPSERSAGDGTEVGWSFARVTAMNGHFPSLPLAGTSPPKNPGARLGGTPVSKGVPKGAWESGTAETRNSSSNVEARGSGVSNAGRGVWGTAKPEASSPWKIESATSNSRDGALVLESGGGVAGSSGKKKGRKAKAVSLFSNAGVRGGGR